MNVGAIIFTHLLYSFFLWIFENSQHTCRTVCLTTRTSTELDHLELNFDTNHYTVHTATETNQLVSSNEYIYMSFSFSLLVLQIVMNA